MPLGLVACGVPVTISGPTPEGASLALTSRDALCVIQPEDARVGSTVYYGSGKTVSDRIARLLKQRYEVRFLRPEDQRDPTASCGARHERYAVVAEILKWGSESSVVVQISIHAAGSRQALRTVRFEAKRRPIRALFGPHESLPREFDEAVLRLLSPG